MNLPIQYTKVFSKRLVPRLCFHGEWLGHLGFEINSLVKIQCSPNQLILTGCHRSAAVLEMLSGTCPYDDSENSQIEQERLQAYSWLHSQSVLNKRLAAFLEEVEESHVLASTVFDLVHLLLKARLLNPLSH